MAMAGDRTINDKDSIKSISLENKRITLKIVAHKMDESGWKQ